jgi:hypothetical protein
MFLLALKKHMWRQLIGCKKKSQLKNFLLTVTTIIIISLDLSPLQQHLCCNQACLANGFKESMMQLEE